MPSKSNSDLEISRFTAWSNQTILGRGTATAPGAGAAIATIAAGSLPSGLYEVTVIANYGATGDVIDNMELRRAAASLLILPINPAANSAPSPVGPLYINLDGTQALSVNAIAAGAVGAVYIARIIARKVMDL